MPSLLQKFKNPWSSNWSNLRYSASSRTDVPHLRDADLDDPKLQGWIWVPWLTSQEPSLPVHLLPFFLRRLSKQSLHFWNSQGSLDMQGVHLFDVSNGHCTTFFKAISHHFEILRHPRWIAWFCLRSFVGHLVSAGYRFTRFTPKNPIVIASYRGSKPGPSDRWCLQRAAGSEWQGCRMRVD